MSRAARSSPNTFTVASDDGTVIGTLLVSALGFIAFNTAGRSLGGFASMDAAIATIESTVAQSK